MSCGNGNTWSSLLFLQEARSLWTFHHDYIACPYPPMSLQFICQYLKHCVWIPCVRFLHCCPYQMLVFSVCWVYSMSQHSPWWHLVFMSSHSHGLSLSSLSLYIMEIYSPFVSVHCICILCAYDLHVPVFSTVWRSVFNVQVFSTMWRSVFPAPVFSTMSKPTIHVPVFSIVCRSI